MAKQLQSIKATETVKKKEDYLTLYLWLKTGRDQIDPTWRLILPNGKGVT